jgi:S-adenosylmethionine-diacylglycerol 3-amino-3-carboxypropyl transferase
MTQLLAAESKGLVHKAVRHAPAFSKQGVQERLFAVWFSGLIYNQIWEDPAVDAKALGLGSHSRVLTISSAGCNALNYLIHAPASITAVDLNHHHLTLTRLKIAAMKHLPDYESFFTFFGLANDRRNPGRFELFVAPHLSEADRRYWLKPRRLKGRRIDWFATGFYQRSRLGQLLGFIHRSLGAIGRSPRRLLDASDTAERCRVFDEVFSPMYSNALLGLISKSPLSVFSLGIPPSQHKEMHKDANGELFNEYRRRTRRLICEWPLEENYFAWQALGRCYDSEKRRGVPDYLRPEHYEAIKSRLHHLDTRLTSTVDELESTRPGAFNSFVFLDSQDWMPPPAIERQWRAIARVAEPGSRIIFRTAASGSPIERSLPPDLLERFRYHREESAEFYRADRAAIYGGFHLYSVV